MDLTSCLELKSTAGTPLEKGNFLPATFSYKGAISAQQESPKHTQWTEETALVLTPFSAFTACLRHASCARSGFKRKHNGFWKQLQVVVKHLLTTFRSYFHYLLRWLAQASNVAEPSLQEQQLCPKGPRRELHQETRVSHKGTRPQTKHKTQNMPQTKPQRSAGSSAERRLSARGLTSLSQPAGPPRSAGRAGSSPAAEGAPAPTPCPATP